MKKILLGTILAFSIPFMGVSQDTVTIEDNSFSPQYLTIQEGETVVWEYATSASLTHDVTSGGCGTPDGKFASNDMNSTNQYYSWTFANSGNYPYYCSYHCQSSQMVGVVEVQSPSSISENGEEGMNIDLYPNPFNEEVNITVNGNQNDLEEVKVFDMTGKEVVTTSLDNGKKDKLTLRSTNWDKGVYFIRITSSEGVVTRKVVKE